MRLSRWFVIFLVVCTPFLLPSNAAALGCFLCSYQLTACNSYRLSDYQWCTEGCTRNPYPSCPSVCLTTYQSGLFACQDDYYWCIDNCENHDPVDVPKQNCPIVLDLGRHGFRFTAAQEGVLFDIDGDGRNDQIAWTDSEAEEGFLVWDRNLNGIIDSGLELFGDSTVQPPSKHPNGFLALALLDRPENGGNEDGVLSKQDKLWGALQIWMDGNHNGRSEANELSSLDSHHIVSIDLAFRESHRKDRHGNELRYWSQVLMDDGKVIRSVDVFFQRLPRVDTMTRGLKTDRSQAWSATVQ